MAGLKTWKDDVVVAARCGPCGKPRRVFQVLREQNAMSTPIRATLWITCSESPPLGAGPQGAAERRTLGTILPRLPHEQTSCSRCSVARRGSAHRTRRTRRSCARPAFYDAGEPCVCCSNRPLEFDDGVDNCVAGKRECSTARVSRAVVRRTLNTLG